MLNCLLFFFGPGRGSDIDLLIVDSDSFSEKRSRRKELARLWRLLASVPVAKDLLLYSRDEMDYWQVSRNHVVGRALREGKVLYENSCPKEDEQSPAEIRNSGNEHVNPPPDRTYSVLISARTHPRI